MHRLRASRARKGAGRPIHGRGDLSKKALDGLSIGVEDDRRREQEKIKNSDGQTRTAGIEVMSLANSPLFHVAFPVSERLRVRLIIEQGFVEQAAVVKLERKFFLNVHKQQMEEAEFRNAIFAHLSREGFVKSYKTQLRMALHKYATANREFAYPTYQHSLKSEIICNIVADYLKAYQYRDTLHVFTEESAYHRLNEDDIMRELDIRQIDGTYLETLMRRKRRNVGSRSIGSQTDQLSVNERLALIDAATKTNRTNMKMVERQRLVTDRLARLREEKEAQLEQRLRHAYEAAKTLEISRAKVDSAERFRTEMHRMRAEFDAMFLARSNELKLAREQEQASIQMLQQELDRQLESLRSGGAPKEQPDELNLKALKRQCNMKVNKELKAAQKLVAERESLKGKIEDEMAQYNETMRVLTEMRQKFAAISTACD